CALAVDDDFLLLRVDARQRHDDAELSCEREVDPAWFGKTARPLQFYSVAATLAGFGAAVDAVVVLRDRADDRFEGWGVPGGNQALEDFFRGDVLGQFRVVRDDELLRGRRRFVDDDEAGHAWTDRAPGDT